MVIELPKKKRGRPKTGEARAPIKPKHQYRTLEEANQYLLTTPVTQWTNRDFWDFIHLMKTVYHALPWESSPKFSKEFIIVDHFVRKWGAEQAKDIIEGCFLFYEQYTQGKDHFKSYLKHFPIRILGSHKMEYVWVRALEDMYKFKYRQAMPAWKKRPQSEWSQDEWKSFHEELKRRKQHGPTA